MAATYTAHKALAQSERRMVDYDIDDALNIVTLNPAATEKCLSLAEFSRFVAGLFRSVGTGSVSEFQIIAATAADGTGATIITEHAIGSAPNAVGDTIWLEATAEQALEVLPTATHIGVRVQLATAGDECVIYFERGEPRFARADLTADYIS
jgi:hypothetical protein